MVTTLLVAGAGAGVVNVGMGVPAVVVAWAVAGAEAVVALAVVVVVVVEEVLGLDMRMAAFWGPELCEEPDEEEHPPDSLSRSFCFCLSSFRIWRTMVDVAPLVACADEPNPVMRMAISCLPVYDDYRMSGKELEFESGVERTSPPSGRRNLLSIESYIACTCKMLGISTLFWRLLL